MKPPLIGCLLATLVGATQLNAQEVSGSLVESSGSPVRAAVVVLVDSAGGRSATALTNASGAFRLRAPGPGTFRVRAERVGFATTLSGPLLLAAGEAVPLRLVANPTAITLEGITVRAGNRCRVEDGSQGTAPIWEEARKALTAAQGAALQQALHYEFLAYRRELDSGSLAVRSEVRNIHSTRAAAAFGSTALDTLLQRGFVRAYGDSVSWDAPDAEVLLSQQFLNTHCFHLVEHPDSAALVGLGFRPTRGRRMPDVTGTLWLERSTSLLRFLEYRYVNAGSPGRHSQVGGRVEFERLPSGHWIVRRWYIRLPQAGPDVVFPGVRTSPGSTFMRGPVMRGLIEVGGEVVRVSDEPLAETAPPADVRGVVWDSIRNRPLAGAVVSVSGTPLSAVADSAGAFRLARVPAGVHTISFSDPLLATLRVPAPTATLSLPRDSGRVLDLTLPGPAAIVAQHCPQQPRGRALVLGRVTVGGTPAAEVEVRVSWSGLAADRRSVDQQHLATRTVEDGSFALCGVPDDLTVQIAVRARTQSERITTNLRGAAVHLHMVDF